MKMQTEGLDGRLRAILRRVFRHHVGPGNVQARDVEEWDSLSHIKLVLELEKEFNIDIDPDSIASLYSDIDTILDYLRKRGVTG